MKKLFGLLAVISVVSLSGCYLPEDPAHRQLDSKLVGTAEGCKIYRIDTISGYLAKCGDSDSFKNEVGKIHVSTVVSHEDGTK